MTLELWIVCDMVSIWIEHRLLVEVDFIIAVDSSWSIRCAWTSVDQIAYDGLLQRSLVRSWKV